MLSLLKIIFIVGIASEGIALKDVYWRDYNDGIIPSDAVPAGNGLYIGQSINQGFLTPGTIYPKSGMFVSEYYGKFEKKDNIKILCSGNPLRFKWEYINVENLPDGLMNRLIEGGYENNMRWYIGRKYHQNEWRIGKVDFSGLKSLLIWNNDGSLHRVYQFEILTYI